MQEDNKIMLLEQLQETLKAHNITGYTTEQLETLIQETQQLLNIEQLQIHKEKDILPNFNNDTYVTEYYPILPEDLTLLINNHKVTPKIVDYSKGIIYLNDFYSGSLICEYNTGIPTETLETDLLPILVKSIEKQSGQNIASISEGDISISYSTSNGIDETSLDALIQKFRNKYDTLIRWV